MLEINNTRCSDILWIVNCWASLFSVVVDSSSEVLRARFTIILKTTSCRTWWWWPIFTFTFCLVALLYLFTSKHIMRLGTNGVVSEELHWTIIVLKMSQRMRMGIELRGRLLGTAFQSQLNEKHGIHETIVTDTEVVPIQRLIMSQRTAQEDQQLQNSNFKEIEARMRITRRALQFIRYGMRPSDDGNGD